MQKRLIFRKNQSKGGLREKGSILRARFLSVFTTRKECIEMVKQRVSLNFHVSPLRGHPPMHELPQVARFCEASPSQKLDDPGIFMVCPLRGHYTERELGSLQSVITAQLQKSVDKECFIIAHRMLVCPFGAPLCQRMHEIKTPHCTRSSLVRGYPCVCPFGALSHSKSSMILLVVFQSSFSLCYDSRHRLPEFSLCH